MRAYPPTLREMLSRVLFNSRVHGVFRHTTPATVLRAFGTGGPLDRKETAEEARWANAETTRLQAAASSGRPRMGFIGSSGLMGHGMTKHLLLKGFPVTMYVRPSRPRDKIADLIAGGAREASTPAAVARASDVVLICVTGAPEVNSVVFGDEGILSAARPGLVVIDSTTNEVDAAAKVRAAFASVGTKFVDAPLTRTPAAAEEGKLNTMVGADPTTFAALQPVFRSFCEHIVHAGAPGQGLVLKLINNFVGQAITTATAEGMATAVKSGLDLCVQLRCRRLSASRSRAHPRCLPFPTPHARFFPGAPSTK